MLFLRTCFGKKENRRGAAARKNRAGTVIARSVSDELSSPNTRGSRRSSWRRPTNAEI
jgi:hypothetical protein